MRGGHSTLVFDSRLLGSYFRFIPYAESSITSEDFSRLWERKTVCRGHLFRIGRNYAMLVTAENRRASLDGAIREIRQNSYADLGASAQADILLLRLPVTTRNKEPTRGQNPTGTIRPGRVT